MKKQAEEMISKMNEEFGRNITLQKQNDENIPLAESKIEE